MCNLYVTEKIGKVMLELLELSHHWVRWIPNGDHNGAYEIPVNDPTRGNLTVQVQSYRDGTDEIWGYAEVYGCGCCKGSRKLLDNQKEFEEFMVFLLNPNYDEDRLVSFFERQI